MVSKDSHKNPDSQASVTTTAAQDQIEHSTSETKTETEIDLEFLYTRDIEFRQETIYFVVVDRFNDGDPENNHGANPELCDSDSEDWGKYWVGNVNQQKKIAHLRRLNSG